MNAFALLRVLVSVAVAGFILLPVLALLISASGASKLALSEEVLLAVKLSLLTATLSTAIIVLVGTPVAYHLARSSSPLRRLLEVVLGLPMVLPPAVAGIALLATFGREGVIGRHLAEFGISLPFTTAAVVIAQTFVALPLYVRSARTGFAGVSRIYEGAAYTLGANELTTFLRISLPLARGSILAGIVLSWARAMGEFGATIMFAGNFVGRTQTMPLAVYSALQVNMERALVLATLLVLISFLILLAVEVIPKRRYADA